MDPFVEFVVSGIVKDIEEHGESSPILQAFREDSDETLISLIIQIIPTLILSFYSKHERTNFKVGNYRLTATSVVEEVRERIPSTIEKSFSA